MGEEGGNREKKRRRGQFKEDGEILFKELRNKRWTLILSVIRRKEGGKELIDPICFKPKFSRAIPSIY